MSVVNDELIRMHLPLDATVECPANAVTGQPITISVVWQHWARHVEIYVNGGETIAEFGGRTGKLLELLTQPIVVQHTFTEPGTHAVVVNVAGHDQYAVTDCQVVVSQPPPPPPPPPPIGAA